MSISRITISLRNDDVGGPVLPQPKVTGKSELCAAHHLVLLVHGYNNNLREATDAYDGFHARQHELDPVERYNFGFNFAELYWPGDADWGIASFLFYMQSIDRARESAEVLGRYLAQCFPNGPVRIDIVAHSMGCRGPTVLGDWRRRATRGWDFPEASAGQVREPLAIGREKWLLRTFASGDYARLYFIDPTQIDERLPVRCGTDEGQRPAVGRDGEDGCRTGAEGERGWKRDREADR